MNKKREGQGAQQLGDLVGGIEAKASATRPGGLILSAQDRKLIEAGAEIATNPPSGEDMAFTHAVLFQQKEKELLTASSPFTFSEVNERSIFKFLRLAGCENQHIGKFQKLVDQRNEIAHPNGNIFFSDQATADQRIEEVMQQIRGIQAHMSSVLRACLLQFLRDSANPDEREIADSEVHVEMNFLHKHYLSRKDIEACLACDLSEFDASPFRGEVEALMQVLQTKAEE